jgi:hypothetical protein
MISLSAQTELVRLFDEYLRVKYVSRRGRWRNCGVIAARSVCSAGGTLSSSSTTRSSPRCRGATSG